MKFSELYMSIRVKLVHSITKTAVRIYLFTSLSLSSLQEIFTIIYSMLLMSCVNFYACKL
jgi:hypothetical protein